MILLFLGSWRSTLIICISIPLSILTSLIILSLIGETINVMTLGGLALAVGILVDDATVEIENIHRNLAQKKPITRAILDGAQQIAVPAFVSTLAICIVFVPVLLLTGAARYLFTPLAMAVVFAMLASYLLSRTLVPTMVHFLLKPEVEIYAQGEENYHGGGIIWTRPPRLQQPVREHAALLPRRARMVPAHRGAGGHAVRRLRGRARSCLVLVVGEDFFPYVDSGQMRLHVRAPEGTRIEQTEVDLRASRGRHPPHHPARRTRRHPRQHRLPTSGINLAFSDSATIGNGDGEILISLNQEKHRPTLGYERKIRETPGPRVSRADHLLPARQHHQPDPEFRPARAHRHPGGRTQRRRPTTRSPRRSSAA